MNKQQLNINLNVEQWLWFAILFTLPLSIRLNSLAVLVGFIVLTSRFFIKKRRINNRYLIFLLPSVVYFLAQIIPLGTRIFDVQTWKEIEQQLPLLAIPVLFLLGGINKTQFKLVAVNAMFLAVVFGSFVMLGESGIQYIILGEPEVFVYHDLTRPFNMGAIFFSLFVIVAMLFIDEISWIFEYKWVGIISVGLLTVMLFLLASKMLLVTGVLLFLIKQRQFIKDNLPSRGLVIPVIFIIILILAIPFGKRINEISDHRLDIVMEDSYTYDSPVNGLNLRLVQARLGFEMLDEHRSWLSGVGMDNCQQELNAKYIEKGLYTGYQGTDDTGYLNYNFHNQYIETLVRSGIVGLVSLLMLVLIMFRVSGDYTYSSNYEIWLLLIFFLTESVLERQMGIMYFCILYSAYFPAAIKNELVK